MKYIIAMLILFTSSVLDLFAEDKLDEAAKAPEIVNIRVFGGESELSPPIINISSQRADAVLESYVMIEFDVRASVPPNIELLFEHWSWDWKEKSTDVINGTGYLQTSVIDWETAPVHTEYYSYRGRVKAPDHYVQIKYSGNWKVLLTDKESGKLLGETRFYAAEPKANCEMRMEPDFYYPDYHYTNAASNFEIVVTAPQDMANSRMNKAVLYRNHRWQEPMFIVDEFGLQPPESVFRYDMPAMIGGLLVGGKKFRIENVPAENGYRTLDLSSELYFPKSKKDVFRIPFSDVRRNGFFDYSDNDGAFLANEMRSDLQDYVLVEFELNPEGWFPKEEIYVSGSFNNWNPDRHWQMHLDTEYDTYKLRQWVRRGMHNYLYMTGRYDFPRNRVENRSYGFWEGNTSTAAHTYFALVYYSEFNYGGYDALVGVASININSSER